jgi:hypothetical protein
MVEETHGKPTEATDWSDRYENPPNQDCISPVASGISQKRQLEQGFHGQISGKQGDMHE